MPRVNGAYDRCTASKLEVDCIGTASQFVMNNGPTQHPLVWCQHRLRAAPTLWSSTDQGCICRWIMAQWCFSYLANICNPINIIMLLWPSCCGFWFQSECERIVFDASQISHLACTSCTKWGWKVCCVLGGGKWVKMPLSLLQCIGVYIEHHTSK